MCWARPPPLPGLPRRQHGHAGYGAHLLGDRRASAHSRFGAKATAIPASDQYDRQAIAQAISQLGAAQAAFTRSAIAAGGVEAWRAPPATGSPVWSTLEDRRREGVHGLAPGGRGRATQRLGRAGRSFSISQQGPSKGSCKYAASGNPPLIGPYRASFLTETRPQHATASVVANTSCVSNVSAAAPNSVRSPAAGMTT